MEQVRYLKRILQFMGLSLVLYPIFLLIWSILLPKTQIENLRYPIGGEGHMHTRIAELSDHAPVDIVFLGSSHTYRSFDPRFWEKAGYTSFNLGSSIQSPIQTELLTNEYIDGLAPKLILFEVYGVIGKFDGVESAIDFIANRPIDGSTIKMVSYLNNIKVLNSLFYGYVRQRAGSDKNFVEPAERRGDRYIAGGFVERTDTSAYDPLPSKAKQIPPLPFQWDAFQRILVNLKDKGYKVLLIRTPVTLDHYKRSNIRSPEIIQWLDQQPNYLDMNAVTELTAPELFFDAHHLNMKGIAKFSPVLLDTLRTMGYIPLTTLNRFNDVSKADQEFENDQIEQNH